MNAILENERLRVTIADRGVELVSVVRKPDPDGVEGACEYIWQGDPQYWAERAPLLFPICGRLPGGRDGHYYWRGRRHEMTIHGFLRSKTFAVESRDATGVLMALEDDAETFAQYPFKFRIEVRVTLDGDNLDWNVRVRNRGAEDALPFAFGFHPGFNVPLGGSPAFNEWELRFEGATAPERIVFSPAPSCLDTGTTIKFPLDGGDTLHLAHSLFENDAIFLRGWGSAVTLRSDGSPRSVRVIPGEGFSSLGLWHAPHSDAPYVCVEPWTGLPSREGAEEDFATKEPFFRPGPGEEVSLGLRMQFS